MKKHFVLFGLLFSTIAFASYNKPPTPVAKGGTGAAAITTNGVVIGQGTSPVTTVAPGTSGNVLTSDGAQWLSSAASGGSTFDADLIMGRSVPLYTWNATPTFLALGSTGYFSNNPQSQETAIAWSLDGRFLTLGSGNADLITYLRLNNRFTKLADVATPPTGDIGAVAWSPNSQYLAVAHDISPYLSLYERNGYTITKLTNPSTLPTGRARGAAWSPDGRFLVIGHAGSPYISIYEATTSSSNSGVVYVKLANPSTLPTAGAIYSAAFSPDGSYLTIVGDTSPFINIYSISNRTFTKLSDPSSLPTGTSRSVAWSPDSGYVAVAHDSSPYITLYSNSSGTLTKLSNPASLPSANCYGVAWNPLGTHLSVAGQMTDNMAVYSQSGSTFTKLASPSTLPGIDTTKTAFDPSGRFLGFASGTNIALYETSTTPPSTSGKSPAIKFQLGDATDWQ